jgi:hypothetical protein
MFSSRFLGLLLFIRFLISMGSLPGIMLQSYVKRRNSFNLEMSRDVEHTNSLKTAYKRGISGRTA